MVYKNIVYILWLDIYGISMRYLWFLYGGTVDGCEILHHQTDGWNPINNGMFTTYQLVQDFFHPPYLGM